MGNSFKLLVGADAFMRELTASLHDCQRSLAAQFMLFQASRCGQAFSELLINKARSGINVRLLVDWYNDIIIKTVLPVLPHALNDLHAEGVQTQVMYNTLLAHGISVQRMAPPGWLGFCLPYRDHRKLIILDEHIAFIGGFNVSENNYAWHDFMVRIEGPLVRDLARDFDTSWAGCTAAFDRPCPDGDFVLNQCADRASILNEVLAMIERAQHTLVIESPYLLGDRVESAIRAAAERGVRVTIILPYYNNHLIYRIWTRKLRRHLSHPNSTLYGYRDHGGMIHAKLIIVDDRWASFGSCNMSELETLGQKELNVFTSNPDLITQLNAMVADDIQHSTPLPPPIISFGRFTYTALYRCLTWWTRTLLRNPRWKTTYC